MTYKVMKTAASRGAKISAKHQITIPIAAVTAAGLRTGDRLRAEAKGRGRVLLVRDDDPVARHAGALTGVYRHGELDELRNEWD
ncbi:MAG: AbrB/MazE/SpoVT family DNA-binding domain-containing protein [Chloroflexi bacterium]|nr:AbrB/MazE/SpoVT family DNA-binding domain-containing protein [Chloroflexota bacterium]